MNVRDVIILLLEFVTGTSIMRSMYCDERRRRVIGLLNDLNI